MQLLKHDRHFKAPHLSGADNLITSLFLIPKTGEYALRFTEGKLLYRSFWQKGKKYVDRHKIAENLWLENFCSRFFMGLRSIFLIWTPLSHHRHDAIRGQGPRAESVSKYSVIKAFLIELRL